MLPFPMTLGLLVSFQAHDQASYYSGQIHYITTEINAAKD